MASALATFSSEVAERVAGAQGAVVAVAARRRHGSSGVIWADGLIATADHALQREEEIEITLPGGGRAPAQFLGREPGADLAILKADVKKSVELQAAAAPRAGELALVLGRSPDSGVNASLGIVSAVSGPWRTWRGGRLEGYIRLDARMFPQSSGGLVVNAQGQVIGLASDGLSRIAGLAVPFATVERVVQAVRQHGHVPHAYVGLGVQAVPLPETLRQSLGIENRSGLIALAVEPEGPAVHAGLALGDVLLALAGAKLEHPADLQALTASSEPGQTLELVWLRGGSRQQGRIILGERP